MILSAQARHEAIVNALVKLHKTNKELPTFRLRKDAVNSTNVQELDINEINSAVSLIVSVFNMTGGSIGSIDLYQLLQAYLTIPQCREGINDLVEAAQRERYLLEKP